MSDADDKLINHERGNFAEQFRRLISISHFA